MRKRLESLIPDNVKTDVAFQRKQLSSCFNINDKTKFPHKHDLVYNAKCAKKVSMRTILAKRQDSSMKGY